MQISSNTLAAFGFVAGCLAVIVYAQPPAPDKPPPENAAVAAIPSYNVDGYCKAADDGSHDYDMAGECIRQEQESFDGLKRDWAATAPEIRTACLNKVQAPRWKFYTQLSMCRDEVLQTEYAEAHPPFKATPPTFKR